MKNYIFPFVLCVLFSSGYAQQPLVVNKLLYKQSDLTASIQSRLDNNGNACGLLKVVSNDKTMTFEGSIVGEPEYKNGEYWIFLPAGTYQIRIKSSEKPPLMLNFRDYNLKQVESKATYELTFNYQSYDKLDMKEYRIVSGPRLKKYAISILTLPGLWTICGATTLEYMQRLSYLLGRDGDGWGEKHNCTILAYDEKTEDGGMAVYYYMLIVESMDDEDHAMFDAVIGHGGFEEKIYEVINN